MTKKLKVISDVFHAWAHQTYESAQCGSVRFQGPVLFSYAEPIAVLLPNNGVLHTTGQWSVTTSSHQSAARTASWHRTSIYAPILSTYGAPCHSDNKAAWMKQLEHCAIELEKHPRRKKSVGDKAANIYAQMHAYSDYFELAWDFSQEALTFAREAVVRRELAERKQREERLAAQAVRLQEWRDGGDDHDWFEVIALRIKGDEIQTSRGARVPVSVAKRLWTAVGSCREHGKCWKPHVPYVVGNYKLDRVDSDGTLHIGCHTIPYTELELIANQLDLNSNAIEQEKKYGAR